MFYVILSLVCITGMTLVYSDHPFIMKYNQKLEGAKSIFKKRKAKLLLWVVKHNNEAMDRELFNGSVILKNLSLVKQDSPLSADFMMESLMENSRILHNIYGEMLIMYRNGRDEDAFKMMAMSIGTKAAKHFAVILARLDKMNPAELEAQMNIFQKSMMENRMTYAIKRVQRNSMILTVLATVTIFVMLLNFVVVVVFMNTLESLNNLFL